MFQPPKNKKKTGKQPAPVDLTNAPIKRVATRASAHALAARTGEVGTLHGREPELLDPPVFRVDNPRKADTQASPGTEY